MKQPTSPASHTREQYLDRPLPSNDEAERACLGGVLLENNLAHELFSYLSPDDFYNPIHRRIAKAMQTLHRTAKKIDPILIGEEFKKTGESIESLGGVSSITNLTYGLPHFRSLKDYIEVIQQKSVARTAINMLRTTTGELLEEDTEPEQVLAQLITALSALRQAKRESYVDLKTVGEEIRRTFEEWASGNFNMSSVSSGIPELDRRLRLKGIAYGELTMIAARPSTGKTALLLQLIKHAAKLGVPSLFFTLEMTETKLGMRMLPAITGIPNKSINPFTLKNVESERNKLFKALESFDLPIYFDRSAQLDRLIATAEHLIQLLGVRVIGVDFFGLINRGAQYRSSYEKVGGLGDIAIALASLAVRSKAAVLAALQLNRESDKEHRRPRMSDIRDSGEIEAAADTLLFPYDKESAFHAKNPEIIKDRIWLDLYCDKQRDGERHWSVQVEYDKDLQTFTSPEMSGRAAPIPENATYAEASAALMPDDDDDEVVAVSSNEPRPEDVPDF